MFDPCGERTLSYRLAAAYDCWGHRRPLRCGSRGGIWFIDAGTLGEPCADEPLAPDTTRVERLAGLVGSGRFTPTEISTLEALVTQRLTLEEIAERDGCTRQAVIARLAGNSRGQGGIVKKARALLAGHPLHE